MRKRANNFFYAKNHIYLLISFFLRNFAAAKVVYHLASTDYISQLSPYLLWDMNSETIDTEKHSASLIQRVLEYGQLSDWSLTRNFYGMDRIVQDCKKLRTLNPKALSFICLISNTNKQDYRCYHFAQSFPTLWNS